MAFVRPVDSPPHSTQKKASLTWNLIIRPALLMAGRIIPGMSALYARTVIEGFTQDLMVKRSTRRSKHILRASKWIEVRIKLFSLYSSQNCRQPILLGCNNLYLINPLWGTQTQRIIQAAIEAGNAIPAMTSLELWGIKPERMAPTMTSAMAINPNFAE